MGFTKGDTNEICGGIKTFCFFTLLMFIFGSGTIVFLVLSIVVSNMYWIGTGLFGFCFILLLARAVCWCRGL
jgi:hypothetical protein